MKISSGSFRPKKIIKAFLLEMFSDEIDWVLCWILFLNFVKIVGQSNIQNSDCQILMYNIEFGPYSILLFFVVHKIWITLFSWINFEKFKDMWCKKKSIWRNSIDKTFWITSVNLTSFLHLSLNCLLFDLIVHFIVVCLLQIQINSYEFG